MKKKISQIIAYGLLLVVIVALVVMATCKKSFAPSFQIPTANAVEIKVPNQAKYDVLTADTYGKFKDTYNSSYELTILYALFSGKFKEQQQIQKQTSEPTFSEGFVVTFIYEDAQTLKINGKDYAESANSDAKIQFKKVVFNVLDGKGLTNTKLYVDDDNSANWYAITTLANFNGLYDLINGYEAFAPQE